MKTAASHCWIGDPRDFEMNPDRPPRRRNPPAYASLLVRVHGLSTDSSARVSVPTPLLEEPGERHRRDSSHRAHPLIHGTCFDSSSQPQKSNHKHDNTDESFVPHTNARCDSFTQDAHHLSFFVGVSVCPLGLCRAGAYPLAILCIQKSIPIIVIYVVSYVRILFICRQKACIYEFANTAESADNPSSFICRQNFVCRPCSRARPSLQINFLFAD